MTATHSPFSKRAMRRTLGLLGVVCFAFAVAVAPATAGQHGGGGGGHGGGGYHGGGWGGGYYGPPPVVYPSPYYCAPPVIYAPGIVVGVPAYGCL